MPHRKKRHAQPAIAVEPAARWPLPAALLLVAGLAWSYAPTLSELIAFWQRNDDYSVGQLVPFFAAYLLWSDRRALLALTARPAWTGLFVLLAAEGVRLAGLYYGIVTFERVALLISLVGLILLAGGWRVLARLRWTCLFLALMIPPPARIHEAVAIPLQKLATSAAAVVLELGGLFVAREGQVLTIDGRTTIGVAEACSGLRMLTAFVFVAAVLAFVIQRPRHHKAILLISSVPIAVLSNSIRTVATALFIHSNVAPQYNESFHDVAGLAMMPLALFASLGLLRLLSWLESPDGKPEHPSHCSLSSASDRTPATAARPPARRSRRAHPAGSRVAKPGSPR